MKGAIVSGAMGHDEPQASSEREEALWCEVVRLRHTIQLLERDNGLLREHLSLLREKSGMAPIFQRAPIPATASKPLEGVAYVRSSGNRVTEENRGAIIEAIRNGAGNAEMARRFGVSTQTIIRIKKQNGLFGRKT